MRSSTNLRKLVLTGSSAMNRRPTSSINIRNFIGTASVRISIPLSATSILPRVDDGGLQASTATYFVPSVNFAFRGHRRSRFTDTLRGGTGARLFLCRRSRAASVALAQRSKAIAALVFIAVFGGLATVFDLARRHGEGARGLGNGAEGGLTWFALSDRVSFTTKQGGLHENKLQGSYRTRRWHCHRGSGHPSTPCPDQTTRLSRD